MEITQIIAMVVIIIAVVFFIIWKIYKDGLRKTAIELIVEVERRFKDNQVKFDTVVNGILVKLPIPFNFIPASIIAKFVQKVFDEIKICLDYTPERKEQ